MKISCVCITYNRKRLLGQLIECFRRQTYEDKELIILDDAGQYDNYVSPEGWRIVSHKSRYPSIADKRNAAMELVSPDSFGILQMDDDDIYLPWAVAATANALAKHQWACPTQTLEWSGPGQFIEGDALRLSRHYTYPTNQEGCTLHRAYGGQWSWRTETIRAVGGYRTTGVAEDSALARALSLRFGPPGDTICTEFPLPFYIYSRKQSGEQHISEMGPGQTGYIAIGNQPVDYHEELNIGWPMDYTALTIPDTVNARPW